MTEDKHDHAFVEPPMHCIINEATGRLYLDPEDGLPWSHVYAQRAALVAGHLRETEALPWKSVRVLEILDEEPGPGVMPAEWKTIVDELPYNEGPYDSKTLNDEGGWWQRDPLKDIIGTAVHHTYSDSPHATARYCTTTKDLPSIQYHIWVTQTGDVYVCAPLGWGMWHDSTGHENKHLSVGMAGTLHKYRPADVQIEAAAKVCAWSIESLPGVRSISEVMGHGDWVKRFAEAGYYKERGLTVPSTACPGWYDPRSELWKQDFYDVLWSLVGKG